MKKYKFKSIAMRIWITFTAIILIIIFSISFFYLVAFKTIDENAKIQDLKGSHEILLNGGNFDKPMIGFGQLKNLKSSSYFILNIDANNQTQILDIGHNQGPPPGVRPNVFDSNAIKLWMGSFIKTSNITEAQFKEVYNNTKYIFVISSITYNASGKSYLISYMPVIEDNNLLYMVLGIGVIFIFIGFITAKGWLIEYPSHLRALKISP